MSDLAPIVIFAYNRSTPLLLLFNSLKANKYFSDSNIYIYVDGPKNRSDINNVNAVKKVCMEFSSDNSRVKIIENKSNYGLKKSVIEGVSKILRIYNKVIILEDDLVLSNDFLEYINNGLSFYEKNEKIWSVCGYSPNISVKNSKNIYYYKRSSSWGWATWKDRWEKVEWDNDEILNSTIKNKNFKNYIKDIGFDYQLLLKKAFNKEIDSWAAYWTFTQNLHKKLSVHPIRTKVINNGTNETGTHFKNLSIIDDRLLENMQIEFDQNVMLDKNIFKLIRYNYYNQNRYTIIKRFIREVSIFINSWRY